MADHFDDALQGLANQREMAARQEYLEDEANREFQLTVDAEISQFIARCRRDGITAREVIAYTTRSGAFRTHRQVHRSGILGWPISRLGAFVTQDGWARYTGTGDSPASDEHIVTSYNPDVCPPFGTLPVTWDRTRDGLAAIYDHRAERTLTIREVLGEAYAHLVEAQAGISSGSP